MKMVAAAKLRRAQDRVHAARPYAAALEEVLGSLVTRIDPAHYPMLREPREMKKVIVIVLSGERGLCGSFNSNTFRAVEHFYANHPEWHSEMILVGKKSRDYFKHHPHPILKSYDGVFGDLKPEHAKAIAEDVVAPFERGEIQGVYIVYNEFVSMSVQRVTERRILPIDPGEFSGGHGVEYLYEPDEVSILNDLLPRYVQFQIWRILSESAASEHAARMTAMEGATRNAEEMIDSLTLVYNRTRQAAITKELIEIVSGSQAG